MASQRHHYLHHVSGGEPQQTHMADWLGQSSALADLDCFEFFMGVAPDEYRFVGRLFTEPPEMEGKQVIVTYLGYARGGKEFEVTADIEALGVAVYCARKIEFLRRGKERRPRPVEAPYLQNYLFIEIPAELFLDVLAIKYLASTLTPLSGADMRSLGRFRDEVDLEYAAAQRIGRNQDAISEYKTGQALRVLDGQFSDKMLTFRSMVDRAHDMHPKVIADMEMMGQNVTVELDPLNVRAAS